MSEDDLLDDILYGEMHWNHRIVKIGDMFGVCEVYFGNDGKITMWTQHIEPMGETVEELKEEVEMFLRAFTQPILKQVGEDEMARLVEYEG